MVLHLGNTPNLDHKLRECKTLNLHYGACHNWSPEKDLLPALDRRGEGRIHIRHEEYLIDYVVHCCSILCKYLPDVGICLAHLSLHIPGTYNIAHIVMTYLPG